MSERHVVIVGGGLAGLSAGCYARASGFRTTVVEHNLALGGVCTAWPRGPYIIDGCIHWLTGGMFAPLYEELGIVPPVRLHVLKEWTAYRDARSGRTLHLTRDLDALASDLRALAPEDAEEIGRMIDGARRVAELKQPFDVGHRSFWDHLAEFWQMRDELGAVMHFRKPIALYLREHIRSAALHRLFSELMPPEAPVLFLLLVLGYLERGHLSRPIGGTAAFRDALVKNYERLGGEVRLHSTVDEVLVDGHQTRGRPDVGRFVPARRRRHLHVQHAGDGAPAPRGPVRWRRGAGPDGAVADVPAHRPGELRRRPAPLRPPLADGGRPGRALRDRRRGERLPLRPGVQRRHLLAPVGHTVVQAMLPSSYDWWATRGARYATEKDAVGEVALAQLGQADPGLASAVRVVDVATPLTFWSSARAWRGAYEGWVPSSETFFGHVKKTLPGLHHFVMAGQWVEPGGGVPTAVLSGRQAVQLLCTELDVPFRLPSLERTARA